VQKHTGQGQQPDPWKKLAWTEAARQPKQQEQKRWLRKSKGEGQKPDEKGTSENKEQKLAKTT